LAAGRKLHDAGQSILVVEARDRIGGRVWTDSTFADFPVEFGAELIHGEHAATHELVRDAGFHTLPAPRKANMQWDMGAGATVVANLAPEQQKTLKALLLAYNQLPTQANLATDEALADYLYRRGFTRAESEMADVLFAQTCCAPIGTLSCADLVREMMADHAGLEEFRIAEGYTALLAAHSAGLPLQLNTPVRMIRRNPAGVAVVTDTTTLHARHVLLTVPVTVLQAQVIAFEPRLSPSKQAAIAAFRTEAATKLLYRFTEPLWDASLDYMMHNGIAARWWTPGYPRPGAAVLCCFVTAKRAEQIDAMSEEDALNLGLDELAQLLLRTDVHEKCMAAKRIAWAHDPYARGGYAHIPPGAAAARPILAQPEGDRLFFAGEATAFDTNPQTVHGAIESGWRAAAEILAASK
jgi:monoamine oxidase